MNFLLLKDKVFSRLIAVTLLLSLSFLYLMSPSPVHAACSWPVSNLSSTDKVNYSEGKITFDITLPNFITPSGILVESTTSGIFNSNPITNLTAATYIQTAVAGVWHVEIPNTNANRAAFQAADSADWWENAAYKNIILAFTNTDANVTGSCDVIDYDLDLSAPITNALPPTQNVNCGSTFVPPTTGCTCLDDKGKPPPIQQMPDNSFCCGWKAGTSCQPAAPVVDPIAVNAACGEEFTAPSGCGCLDDGGSVMSFALPSGKNCCGYGDPKDKNACKATFDRNGSCFSVAGCGQCAKSTEYCTVSPGFASCSEVAGQCGVPTVSDPKTDPPASDPVTDPATDPVTPPTDPATQPKPGLNIFAGPTAGDFTTLNPLSMFKSAYAEDFTSPAGIINRVLLFAFPLAGLILFVMIIWGGFEMIYGATGSKGVEAGRQRITAALMGFGLLFVSFWIIQIVEYIFNIAIL